MKRKEILAPVGSYESMLAAVQNGCDAIYVGGVRFGARAFANNFSEEQLIEAIKYCHLYGVAVYVTVNTLVYESELEEALAYIGFLHKNQVDAIIVQDVGILYEVRRRYPTLVIHASTQMHIHNVEGVKLLQSLGVKRVVLSRECAVSQIKEIHLACPDMELEIFVYGAHCVSYSGQCLLSSMIGGRSGNRGECAQPCRLTYDLVKSANGKMLPVSSDQYSLSMKDLNVINSIDQLMDAGVTSFKIEGRMKRPEYVAKVVSIFRSAFDAHAKNHNYKVSFEDNQELLKLFHRGVTPGHIFNQRGSDLMNFHRPNHIGIPLGEVVYVHPKEKRIGILLQESLYQGDGIRFLNDEDVGWTVNRIYKNDLLVNQGSASEIIEIDWREGIYKQNKIVKTSDIKLMERLRQTFMVATRKVPVQMKMVARVGESMSLTLSDGQATVVVLSMSECVQATTSPLSEERIQQQMSKLNDTPFVLEKIVIDIDHQSVLPISQLNQMRRDACSQLIAIRELRSVETSTLDAEISMSPQTSSSKEEKYYSFAYQKEKSEQVVVSCSVYHEEQFQAARDCGITRIYVHSPEVYQAHQREEGIVCSSKRVNETQTSYPGTTLLVREMGALYQALQNKQSIYIDDVMNVSNAKSIAFFHSFNAKSVTLSNELSLTQIKAIFSQEIDMDVEVNVYGRIETMLMKYCVINTCTVDTKEKDCNMCRIGEQYYLVDRKSERYPVLTDQDCFSHLLHSKPLMLLEELHEIVACGVNVVRVNLTIESYEESKKILSAFQQKLQGKNPRLFIENTTKGYYSK